MVAQLGSIIALDRHKAVSVSVDWATGRTSNFVFVIACSRTEGEGSGWMITRVWAHIQAERRPEDRPHQDPH